MVQTLQNKTMRIISGTLKPTSTMWQPTLSNKAFPNLRREHALIKEFRKITNNPQVHNDVANVKGNRHWSRQPSMQSAHQSNFHINIRWRKEWESKTDRSGKVNS